MTKPGDPLDDAPLAQRAAETGDQQAAPDAVARPVKHGERHRPRRALSEPGPDDPESLIETRTLRAVPGLSEDREPAPAGRPATTHVAPWAKESRPEEAEPEEAEPKESRPEEAEPEEAEPKEPQPEKPQPEEPESLVDSIDRADRQNLGRNSLLMASGTLASRMLGMVNATLQVSVLGQAVVADAFKSANTLPNFILVLLSGGILNAVLIPQITKAMKRADGGKDFVDRLLTAAFALILVVALLSTAGAGLFMRTFTTLSGAGLQLGIAFAFLCMPQVLFYGIFAVLGNILNARGSFGPYGWAPVANNIVAIAGEVTFLYLWGKQDDPALWTPQMVWVLAGTATLGIAVQAIVLIPPLLRTGFRWTPRWGLRGHGFGQLGRFASLTFLALLIAQGGGLLIMKVATFLVDAPAAQTRYVAGYAAYQNALSLFQVPYSLIAVSLLTAFFPQIARAWQRRDDASIGMTDIRSLLHRGLTLPAIGIIPASVMLVALAGPIVRVIYFGLDAEQAQATAWLLMLMAISTLGYTVVTLQQQYCFATEQGRTNLWMQSLVTGVQMGFALLALLVPAQYGMVVVCVGMIVGNYLLAVVFIGYARHQIGDFGLGRVVKLYARLGAASILSGLAAWGTSVLILGQGEGWLGQFAALAAGGVVFVLALLTVAKLMRLDEVFNLVNPVLRRLRLPQI